MVTVLGVLGVLVVLFVAAVLATRADPLLADAPRDRPDVVLPEGAVHAGDVAEVRFPLALRGYRMSDVDAVLDRLAAELAARDRRIAELTEQPARHPAGRPAADRAGGGPGDRPE